MKNIETMSYHSIATKLYLVDTVSYLNPNPKYDIDPKIKAYTYDEGERVVELINQETAETPFIKVSKGTTPKETNSDSKQCIINRIKRKIDRLGFNILLHNCPSKNIMSFHTHRLTDYELSLAMSFIERNQSVCCRIVAHPTQLAAIRVMRCFEAASARDTITTGLQGQFLSVDVFASTEMPEDHVLLTGIPQYMGIMPLYSPTSLPEIDKNIKFIQTNSNDTILTRMGSIETNMLLLNPNLVAKIKIY